MDFLAQKYPIWPKKLRSMAFTSKICLLDRKFPKHTCIPKTYMYCTFSRVPE